MTEEGNDDYAFLPARITDTAGIACGAGSMKLLGVRPSVCSSVPFLHATAQVLSSRCEQCHVVSCM